MFGKWYEQTYTGSMCGKGLAVFAVWGYVVAHTHFDYVELNPILVAAALGCSSSEVEQAIEYLCSPDPQSRSQTAEGRRIVREGQFIYFVPNHHLYRTLRDNDDRREYNRQKKAESRARTTGVNPSHINTRRLQSTTVNTPRQTCQPPSAQPEPEPYNQNQDLDGKDRKDLGGSAPGKSKSVSKNGNGTPTGLNELQYAARLMEEIKMPNTRHNLEQVAAGIKSESSTHGGLNHAYDFVLTQAKAEIELKGRVTGFWFQDAKWRTKKPKAHDPFESLARVKEQRRKAIEKLSQ